MDLQSLQSAAHELVTSTKIDDPLPLISLSQDKIEELEAPTQLEDLIKLVPTDSTDASELVSYTYRCKNTG